MTFPPRMAFAVSRRFCLVAPPSSFVLRFVLISAMTLSLAHRLFSILLFSLSVIFFFPPVSLSLVDFLFHAVIVRKDAWNNFCPLKFVETYFRDLACDLSWQIFHVHLKTALILMILNGTSYRYLLCQTGLLCHLRPMWYFIFV